jgi:hypothetical protein
MGGLYKFRFEWGKNVGVPRFPNEPKEKLVNVSSPRRPPKGGFSELAVFDARLYIRVRRIDEIA